MRCPKVSHPTAAMKVQQGAHRDGSGWRVNPHWNLSAGAGNLAVFDFRHLLGRSRHHANQRIDTGARITRRIPEMR